MENEDANVNASFPRRDNTLSIYKRKSNFMKFSLEGILLRTILN